MIIDCHAHVFAFPKIKPYPEAPTPFLSVEEQIKVMNLKGIDKAIILPLNNAETCAEHQSIGEILHICQMHPDRFIPFCNIDPRLPKRPDLIKVEDFDFLLNQYTKLGCKGIGEITARIEFDHPSLMLLFEACQKVEFPVTFHTITADTNSYGIIDDLGFPRLEKVLQKFPNLKFFGHSQAFWSEMSADVTLKEKCGYPQTPVKPGGTTVKLMRKYKNLYGDISAGSGLNAFTRDPAHAFEFIDEFQDKILFGLDYCSATNNPQHIEWLTNARDRGKITEQAYQKIMWKNINDILNLGITGD